MSSHTWGQDRQTLRVIGQPQLQGWDFANYKKNSKISELFLKKKSLKTTRT